MSSSFKNICNGLISSSPSLLQIEFSHCKLSEEQGFWFGNLLSNCTSLNKVNLSENKEMRKGFERICNGLKSSSSSLQSINLSFCSVSEEFGYCLGDLLSQCTTLIHIDLSYNNQLKRSFEKICNGLKSSSSSLQSIDLSFCYLSEDQGYFLGDILSKCSSINDINLSYNDGLKKSFKSIFNALKSSCKFLQKLKLNSCCLLKNEGFYLSDLLPKCKSLIHLELNFNSNLEASLERIFHELKFSSALCLQYLDFTLCKLSEEEGFWLGDLLSKCLVLNHLHLSDNDELENGFKSICDGLKSSCKSLQTLNLHNCELSEEQGFWLGDLLSRCTTLVHVDLSDNNELENGFESICIGLKSSSSTLEHLDLSDCLLSEEQEILLNNLKVECNRLELTGTRFE